SAKYQRAWRARISSRSSLESNCSSAYSRVVCNRKSRPLSAWRTRLLSISDRMTSRSAWQICSAASSSKLPTNTASRVNSRCSGRGSWAGPRGVLARRGLGGLGGAAAPAGQEREPLLQPVQELPLGEELDPRRRKLQRERKSIESLADRVDLSTRLVARLHL